MGWESSRPSIRLGLPLRCTLTSRIATRNFLVDLLEPGKGPKTPRRILDYFRRPTRLLPTDGVVKATALEITKSARTDVEKARAIYDWIVDHTFRDPKRHCRAQSAPRSDSSCTLMLRRATVVWTASIRTTSNTRSARRKSYRGAAAMLLESRTAASRCGTS